MGQHFLVNETVVRKQCDAAGLDHSDVVLEIGPGLGILTEEMLARGCKVIAVEMDDMISDHLELSMKDYIKRKDLQLIRSDVLKLDNAEMEEWGFNKVVANIPYNISSPLMFKLLDISGWELGILMLQSEFAARLYAPKDTAEYSRLTVNTYYRAETRRVMKVSKGNFHPVPRVDSAIVELKPRKEKAFELKDEKTFHKVVDGLFTQRRKKVRTALVNRFARDKEAKARLRQLIDATDWADLRGENLTPEQIGTLSDLIFEAGF